MPWTIDLSIIYFQHFHASISTKFWLKFLKIPEPNIDRKSKKISLFFPDKNGSANNWLVTWTFILPENGHATELYLTIYFLFFLSSKLLTLSLG